MGVTRLWELIAPCGRRCSVDALARKRLAVDASIWIIQFIKAMRDESGEMIQNAPLLGLFRRLCKLLFLHVRPVLVFDGATPALKQRTVVRRQAFRARQEGSLKRTAEKILLNQLKGKHLLHGLNSEALPAAPASASMPTGTGSNDTAMQAAIHSQFGEEDARFAGAWTAAPEDARVTAKDDGGWEVDPDDDADAPPASLADFVQAAAAKGGVSAELNASGAARLSLGSIVVPRAADLDTEAIRHLPPAMQFELLDEIKLNERNTRRDRLVRSEHTAESFSHQQLQNYIEVSKVAGQVSKLRSELSEAASSTRRIAGDDTREYVLMELDNVNATDADDEEVSNSVPAGKGAPNRDASSKVHGSTGAIGSEDSDVARAVALSMEDAAASRRRAGKQRVGFVEPAEPEQALDEAREESQLAAAIAMSVADVGQAHRGSSFCAESNSCGSSSSVDRGSDLGDVSGGGGSSGGGGASGSCNGGSCGCSRGSRSGACGASADGSGSGAGNDRDHPDKCLLSRGHAAEAPVSIDLTDDAEFMVRTGRSSTAASTDDGELEISFDIEDGSDNEADDDLFPMSFFSSAAASREQPLPGVVSTTHGTNSDSDSAIDICAPSALAAGGKASESSACYSLADSSVVGVEPAPPTSDNAETGSSAWRMHAKKRLWSATKFTDGFAGSSIRGARQPCPASGSSADGDARSPGECDTAVTASADRVGIGSDFHGRESISSGAQVEATIHTRGCPGAAGWGADAKMMAPSDVAGAEPWPKSVRDVHAASADVAGEESEARAEAGVQSEVGAETHRESRVRRPADQMSVVGARSDDAVVTGISACSSVASGATVGDISTLGSSGNSFHAMPPPAVGDSTFTAGYHRCTNHAGQPVMDEAEQERLRHSLAAEAAALYEQQRRLKRDSSSVTADMYEESKQLLSLFGVPFIVAPAEAEA